MFFVSASDLFASDFQIVIVATIDRAIAMFFDLPARRTVDNFASFERCITCCATSKSAR